MLNHFVLENSQRSKPYSTANQSSPILRPPNWLEVKLETCAPETLSPNEQRVPNPCKSDQSLVKRRCVMNKTQEKN